MCSPRYIAGRSVSVVRPAHLRRFTGVRGSSIRRWISEQVERGELVADMEGEVNTDEVEGDGFDDSSMSSGCYHVLGQNKFSSAGRITRDDNSCL